MTKVLIAGGTGLVGKRLSYLLTQKGYTVALLSRSKKNDSPYQVYQWNVNKQEIDPETVATADYIINLAGAGIADELWTKSRRALIINSRIKSTLLLKKQIELQRNKPKYGQPKAYISASAIGYYGDRGDKWLDEESTKGKGFLTTTTVLWEEAIQDVAKTGLRTVALRIGIVLSTQGGAMEKMLLSFKVRVGAYFGDGSQWYSWIHIDDLCRMFIAAIEKEEMNGIYNAVAPHPATNKVLTEELANALDKASLVLPTPKFVLKMGMGEMSSVVLNSTRVSSKKIEATGFEFEHGHLSAALKNLVQQQL